MSLAKPSSKSTPFRRWLVVGLLLLGALLASFFGWRAYHYYDHLQKIEAGGFAVEYLRGWMTMPYIATVYGIPETELYSALKIPSSDNSKLSLRKLIRKYDLDPVAARHALEELILNCQSRSDTENNCRE